MALSPMAGYAAKALGYLSVNVGAPKQVREIAQQTQVPAPYLAKIIHQLGRKGIVRTRRGVGGGVELAVDAKSMTLLELCEAIEDPILEPQCMLGLGRCDDDCACPAHAFSQSLRQKELDFLEKTTLADVGRFAEARQVVDPPKRKKGKR